MDADEEDHPSLPPNYVSLADLRERWLQQQEEKRRAKQKEAVQCEPQRPNRHLFGGNDAKQQGRRIEKQKEECQLQQPNLGLKDVIGGEDVKEKPQFRNSKNPNLHNRRPFRWNYRDQKGPKEYQLVRNNNPQPKLSKIEGDGMDAAEIGGGDGTLIDQVDSGQKSKIEKKTKKKKKYRNKKKTQNREIKEGKPAEHGEYGKERENEVKEADEAPLKLAVEVEQKLKRVSVKGRVWKNNETSMKPGRNGECVQERENEVKRSSETPWKPSASDQTLEVEEKFKKLSVSGRVWRSNGRSKAVIERPSRVYRAYGGGESRGARKMRSTNGLVWVKKGEVPEHARELKL